MKTKILVLYYSMYGNNYLMAKAVGRGIEEAGGEAVLRTVPELVPQKVIDADAGIKKAKEMQKGVPIAKLEDLENIDGIILGSPTRFGNMCAQMRNFLDQTGGLWAQNAFVGKIGSAFTSSSTQHGGQETTLLTIYITLLHLGMIIVGLPYSEIRQTTMSEITGGSPYGTSSVTGPSGSRMPSENELAMARFQGRQVATIASKLVNACVSGNTN